MIESYMYWDLRLEDLVYHCATDLIPWSIIYYDGHVWRLKTIDDFGEYTAGEWIKIEDHVISVDSSTIDMKDYYKKSEIDAMLECLDCDLLNWLESRLETIESKIETLESNYESIVERIETLETKVETLETKVEEIIDSNPEEVKFVRVTMDGDTETEFSNEWITADTDAIITWTSGEPNWIIETYVENGKLIIRSSENETWTARVRLSKPKDGAFLN